MNRGLEDVGGARALRGSGLGPEEVLRLLLLRIMSRSGFGGYMLGLVRGETTGSSLSKSFDEEWKEREA